MGIENTVPQKQDAFTNEKGVAQPFSQEGLLNRNLGEDVEKPTSGLFYRDGILNRAKFHEDFGKVYNRVMNGGATTEAAQETSVGNSQLESAAQESSVESQTVLSVNESLPESRAVDQAISDLFDVFKNEKDPEGAAFDYIKGHLDLSLSVEEQLAKIRDFKTKYQEYKDKIVNSFK